MDSGKLYIVATPIGNLKDITFRAIEVLKEVDYILSEDTRETDKLLKYYDINNKSQIAYRDQNHTQVYLKILDILLKGNNLALISDSGTPLISDPGFKLVSGLIKENIQIISIPGPSAVISSLVAAGLPTDRFSFIGFLPKKDAQRKKVLAEYKNLDSTLIIYESPFRMTKLLTEIEEVLGNRKICIANELTKIHERLIYGEITSILANQVHIFNKGEFVVLIAKEGF